MAAERHDEHDWDAWRRPRQAAAVATVVMILGGMAEMPSCETVECIAVTADKVTTSLVGPPDGPPTSPVSIDTTVSSNRPGEVTLTPAVLRLAAAPVLPLAA
jgi:hypothetical protein